MLEQFPPPRDRHFFRRASIHGTIGSGETNMALKIIGAGLGRTGTVSLKIALEQLGVGRCYHMLELLANPAHMALWQKAVDGRPDWDAIFADYGATVDYPGCACWRELAAFYPAAKVVLTVRDPDAWFDSTQATIFSADTKETLADPKFATVAALMNRLHPDRYDRVSMAAAFERHTRAVIGGIPKERLLVYQVGEGWEPLCAFLGVPVPDMPFPRANVREEIKGIFAQSRNADGSFNVDHMQQMMTDKIPPR
jgi:Sulfotransferase domain